jgi:dienelactone hydrolase
VIRNPLDNPSDSTDSANETTLLQFHPMKKFTLSLLALLLAAPAMTAQAAVKTQVIDYKDGDVALQGYLAYDDSKTSAPGVLVVHEWWGNNDYSHKRAEQLAELGYVAFALDMYGKGVVANDPKEAGKLAGPFHQDRALTRSRATAGLNVLKSQKNVDTKHIAAIGYCFGGSTVIELARGGADLVGVVSFHGGLDFPNPEETKNIKGHVLICTGADDPMVTPDKVTTFEDQLRKANIDYEINVYGGAVHAFSNPAADAHNIPGIKYNEKADQRSWAAMKAFFAEIFK